MGTPIPGTGLSTCCLTGTTATGTPVGTISSIAGMNCYVSLPQDGVTPLNKAVVLNPDVFGMQYVNAQLLADKFAAKGYSTVVVDYFKGKPMAPVVMDLLITLSKPELLLKEGEKPTWIGSKLKSMGAVLALLGHFPPFIARHGLPPPMGPAMLEGVRKVVAALREGALPTGPVTRVGGVGYCWGGGYGLVLGGALSDAAKNPSPPAVFDAVAVAHTSVKVPDFLTGLQVPTLIVAADKDSAFPDAEVVKAQQLCTEMEAKGKGPFKIKQYPGTFHGFACRGDERNTVIKEAKEDAFNEMVAWFQAHL